MKTTALIVYLLAAMAAGAQAYDSLYQRRGSTSPYSVQPPIWVSIPTGTDSGIWGVSSNSSPVWLKPLNGFTIDFTNKTISATAGVQTMRAQSDSNGNYTWTFSTPFTVGTTPKVVAIVEGGTVQPINVQIVGTPTYTNCVFKVITLPSTTVLGVVVLGAPLGAQAYINAVASP